MTLNREADPRSTDLLRFLMLFGSMVAMVLASWPTEFSFDLWVFKDRGNFLNFAYLLDKGFRPGVDTYYLYGLLPVLLQDVVFDLFGRGPWPIIGLHICYLALMSAALTVVVRHTPKPMLWNLGAIALVPIIIWVNPNLSYVLVQVTMLWSIALLLERRYRLAVVVSAFGCWSVPSLPLVLSASLVVLLFACWWLEGPRTLKRLLQLGYPGLLAYLGIGAGLAAYFSIDSVLATALPFQGASFYKAVNYGFMSSLKVFLYPGQTESRPNWSALRYFVFDRATWWVLATVLLTIFGTRGFLRMWRERQLDPKALFVLFCAVMQIVFILVAYGTPPQHIIYDPLVAAGTLLGLSMLAASRARTLLIGVFFTVTALSHGNQASYTWWLWKATKPSPDSAGFYSPPEFTSAWKEVVDLSKQRPVFLLSYATGVHHYFPTIDTAESWLIQWGQTLPPDRERLLAKLRTADVVVEDVTGITTIFERDEEIKAELAKLCMFRMNPYFIYWSRTPDPVTGECRTYVKDLPADPRMRGENAV